ncbi:formate dehydrogenase accessory sulfurtransferase FdhD [Arsenicibacter rosenii]|uniref:Sulfur carrier protein FdhD n=1 Tax=Arsenicibacter rosenii TaxID=1750698 RepID=A0A1S2VQP7_9BACT|nr:formate dehydrogenase accessory sulfurtransferase FdhD [Arsenicibacter rosenii]OIN61091.1 formate dehydrogenase family accessory protein FdhD [Arsenicibacter rosenii]
MVSPVIIQKVIDGALQEPQPDLLAIEEPLEIRLGFGPIDNRQQRSLSVTMRTPGADGPGADQELALGYLYAEGIIREASDVVSCRHCVQDATKQGNVLRVELQPSVLIDWQLLERHTYASSSCGICGKASIDAVRASCPATMTSGGFRVDAAVLQRLSDRVQAAQRAFSYTGGVHAAALFDADGQVLMLREDVGRHNALDKLVGAALWNGQVPLQEYGIFLSGRIGFELVQKAWMAGVPVLVAVGAPTSLAVEMAREAGITLIGFMRNQRFNVYTGVERVVVAEAIGYGNK